MDNAGRTAVVHYIGWLDDGSVFDSSRSIEPMEFKLGSGNVIRGFDTTVANMAVGETRRVSIPAHEAYGLWDESKILTQMMCLIPGAKDIKVGKTFYFRTSDGLSTPAKVIKVEEGLAYVDFNHPLAGQTLTFEIELIELR